MTRERNADWRRQPESVALAELVRQLNQRLRLRGVELRQLQDRIDGLKARVGVLEP
jgi:hypothetical protein